MANIMITDITITPNPVAAGKKCVIQVGIADKVYGLLDKSGKYYLMTKDGYALERKPRQD